MWLQKRTTRLCVFWSLHSCVGLVCCGVLCKRVSESTEKGGLRSDFGYDDGKRRMESLRWTMEEDLATFVSLSLCVGSHKWLKDTVLYSTGPHAPMPGRRLGRHPGGPRMHGHIRRAAGQALGPGCGCGVGDHMPGVGPPLAAALGRKHGLVEGRQQPAARGDRRRQRACHRAAEWRGRGSWSGHRKSGNGAPHVPGI